MSALMENTNVLNFRFLSYSKYKNFYEDLHNQDFIDAGHKYGKIREDAIVFIKDKLRIWARGQEYACNAPIGPTWTEDGMEFRDLNGNVIFKLYMNENEAYIVRQQDGNEFRYKFLTPKQFNEYKTSIDTSIRNMSSRITNVENKLGYKQDILEAGYGIKIEHGASIDGQRDVISLEGIDNAVFEIVEELPKTSISSTKIYILQELQEDGITYKYIQYKHATGGTDEEGTGWTRLGEVSPSVNLGVYAKKSWVDNLYVAKERVYTPKDNGMWPNTETPTIPQDDEPQNPDNGGDNGNTHESCKCDFKLITLHEREYERLVASGAVEENTYYFTYKDWEFGEQFPIILSDGWAFDGAFPIKLK